MGYSYTRSGALACDDCGNGGRVQKRTCPYVVDVISPMMTPMRAKLPYCYPPALCPACWQKHKATVHANCEAGAAASSARYAEQGRRLDAGELAVSSRFGDWHAAVPAGYVGVYFRGWHGEAWRLVPVPEPAGAAWLSDYPTVQDWIGHPA